MSASFGVGQQFGTAADGRLFRGERNDEELPRGTVNPVLASGPGGGVHA